MAKFQIKNFKVLVIGLLVIIWNLVLGYWNFSIFAQETELEFTLDVTSQTTALPKIFKPNIDLSGRGFNNQSGWPQTLAVSEVLDLWQKDIGFNGIFRLQYNLWEITQLAKDKATQDQLLNNYESVIKRINDAGGIVLLDIFGMPAGLGKILDKKSPPVDPKAFKELIKKTIRGLSCEKRYNIWYEVWSAPDLDEFFLGKKQDYLNLYRALAEAVKELEAETKIYIPIGGPAVSWWFQNLDGNTVVSAEKSLIYELIKFCAAYKLPLDFITWHAYSTDPQAEKETTIYKKNYAALIRDWLSYFNFDRNTPLIIDEWNYDREINLLPERGAESFISASYIPLRIENMYAAGLDYQLYFSLEDFQNNKEGINRNVGIFWFDSEASGYKGGPKPIYNVFRMLAGLGDNLFLTPKLNDEFISVIATKKEDDFVLIISNYIDADIAQNYLSRNIAGLNDGERKILLSLIKSDKFAKILRKELDLAKLRVNKRLKSILKKAQELDALTQQFKNLERKVKIGVKNLKDNYLYQRYAVDASCKTSCEFLPAEEKELPRAELYQETLTVRPYSVNMIVLKKKPPVVEKAAEPPTKAEPPANVTGVKE
jgi:hypothetical protein